MTQLTELPLPSAITSFEQALLWALRAGSDPKVADMLEAHAGALRVQTGAIGTPASSRLVARHTAPTSDQIWKSETGCKQFFAQPAGALTPGTGVIYTQGLAVAWSTIYDDHAGLGTLLAAALANFSTAPVEPVAETANVLTMWVANDKVSKNWDGTNRIKSIGAIIIGATPGTNTVAIALTTVT